MQWNLTDLFALLPRMRHRHGINVNDATTQVPCQQINAVWWCFQVTSSFLAHPWVLWCCRRWEDAPQTNLPWQSAVGFAQLGWRGDPCLCPEKTCRRGHECIGRKLPCPWSRILASSAGWDPAWQFGTVVLLMWGGRAVENSKRKPQEKSGGKGHHWNCFTPAVVMKSI